MDHMPLDQNGRQSFPPWNLFTLIIWLVGFIVLSGVVAGLFGYAVLIANSQYGLNLNPAEINYSIVMPSLITYMGLIFAFIVYQFKRKSHSLKDAWLSYALNSQHIVVSLLLGILLMSLQILIYKALTGSYMLPLTSDFSFDWRITLGLELIAKAFMPGLVEEILFRGIFYQTLRKRFSITNSVLLSALIFALFHIEFLLNPLSIAYVFLVGLVTAVLFERTRSLNPCIAFHVAGNSLERVIYYSIYIIPVN